MGGHGPIFDLSKNFFSLNLIRKFWSAKKLVSAVCHGPAALVNARDSYGRHILKGKNVTGFTNSEDKEVRVACIGV